MVRITIALLITLFFTVQSVFAQEEENSAIPDTIRNNKYYLESVRLTKLAQETYEYGDYDASTGFAEEAIRFALLSDEFIASHVKFREADDAIAAAKHRLDWADSNNVARQYPNEYNESKAHYNDSLASRSKEEWDAAIASATRVIEILAFIGGAASYPAQYVVRNWSSEKDCLWNIAGYPWVYGEPERWRVLYDANKSKMPEPDNPNLVEPGMVLDIPSIRGETREGVWDSNRTYGRP
jgi:hypothetical protein